MKELSTISMHRYLKEVALLLFSSCYFYSGIYSVQFTDTYPFAEYDKYNCASEFNLLIINEMFPKGLVKLIKWVKIAHSFSQSVSNQFHVIILSLPMSFFKWLSKNFSKPSSKNGETGCFNRSLLIQSF